MTTVPPTLGVIPEGIPADLRELAQWVGWRWLQRDGGKWTKPPLDPKTGSFAKPNDPSTWASFDDAWRLYENGKADGVGFMFTEHDPFVGIDLDDCRDPDTGALQSWAYAIVQRMASYAEVSPSGTGVKVICRGALPVLGTNKPGGWPVEIYRAGRFFALTGQRIESAPAEVCDASEAVAWLYERITTEKPPAWVASLSVAVSPEEGEDGHRGEGEAAPPDANQATTDAPDARQAHRTAQDGRNEAKMIRNTARWQRARASGSHGLGDDDLLAIIGRSAQAAKFDRLMAGDGSGYASPSQADIALCNLLAFYSDDAGQIDRIFRQSGLWREKWDSKHAGDGATYGEMTIADALAYVRNGGKVYDPDYRSAAGAQGGPTAHRAAQERTSRQSDTTDSHRKEGDAAPPPLPGLADPIPWLPLPEILEAYHRAEMGDAELLAALYAGRIVYDHAEKAWYVWAGHCWQRDRLGQVENLPGRMIAAQYLYGAAEIAKTASTDAEQERVKELNKRAFSLRTRTRRNNVLDLASTQPGLALSGEEWDTDSWLLAAKNGVIDLRSGELRAGKPGDYLRIVAPAEWQGIDAPAPRWERFLTEVFDNDAELIAFVQRLLGYAITGLATEHVLPILWGKGRNGKDTLLKALAHTLGPGFADAVLEDVFIDAGRTNGGAAMPHVYKLRGLRLAWASETEEGARLKAGQVKLLTGGGILTARPLYGEPVSWQATHTVLLITNHRPHASADDYALWQRIALIPFTLSFVDEPEAATERKRDPHLDAKLKAEAPGILAWLVRGCLAWQREGLRPPAKVKEATAEYRSDEDTLGQWLAECCIMGDGYTCRAQAAYGSYATWCETMKVKPLTGTAFGRKLAERFSKEDTRTGIIYRGLGLLTEAAPSA